MTEAPVQPVPATWPPAYRSAWYVAIALDCPVETVWRLVKVGRLRAERMGTRSWIETASVEELLKEGWNKERYE